EHQGHHDVLRDDHRFDIDIPFHTALRSHAGEDDKVILVRGLSPSDWCASAKMRMRAWPRSMCRVDVKAGPAHRSL
ncbi:MAG: hypothetical protein ACRD2A_21655, partial [Vicinamibacterales bacterium]